jgi:UDP-N-acetylglucosamine acyltransferase
MSIDPTISIHPSAVVEDGASLGACVTIGPFCYVGANVTLEDGCILESHVVISGATHVGARTHIFPFASIGHKPQDLKFKGEKSQLFIGADCQIREGVTINPGTEGGGLITRLGDRCTLLANSHVAHDCLIGDDVILSNNVMVAGHCTIGDFVVISGGVGIHQFCRIGSHAFVCGLTALTYDLIPYGLAQGNPAHVVGLNLVGLQRRGFSRDEIHALRGACRLLFAHEGTLQKRMEDVLQQFGNYASVHEILVFARTKSRRSLCMSDVRESDKELLQTAV